MKDKLRELAERWKARPGRVFTENHMLNAGVVMGKCECAAELLAILDAEGDGGAVQIPELRIGAPAWPGQMEGKAPPEEWVQLSVNNLPPHPARSGVVSDEDVRDAQLAMTGYWCDCNDANVAGSHSEAMRAALEHFAKGERHER